MKKKLAVLHTSLVFITTRKIRNQKAKYLSSRTIFRLETMMNDLFGELLPEVDILHFVDSDLLGTVLRAGQVASGSVRRLCYLAQAAQAAGVDLMLSACSSPGPAVDVARHLVEVPIVKIDDAMAQRAAEDSTRIGVLATVPTTLAPTAAPIGEKAASTGKAVQVYPRLCQGAFEALMSGQRDRHDTMVLEGAMSLAPQRKSLRIFLGVDIIALAHAVQRNQA